MLLTGGKENYFQLLSHVFSLVGACCGTEYTLIISYFGPECRELKLFCLASAYISTGSYST